MNENNINFEITDGVTFKDITKDILDRSSEKKDRLDTLVSDVRSLIKNVNDAVILLPNVKELLDVGVKNDEQLIKLAGVWQRLYSSKAGADEEKGKPLGLTDEEREALLKNSLIDLDDIKKEVVVPVVNEPKIEIVNPITIDPPTAVDPIVVDPIPQINQ